MTESLLAAAITVLGVLGSIAGYAAVVAVCAASVIDEFPSTTAGPLGDRELSSLVGATARRGFLSHQALNVCEWVIGPFGTWGSFSRGYLLGAPLATLLDLCILAVGAVTIGSLIGSWATRRCLRPSYWGTLSVSERAGRGPVRAAWRDAGMLLVFLPLLSAALACLRVALTVLDPFPSPLAWPGDALLGATALAAAAVCRTLAVNRAIIVRSIGPDRLLCRCDYPLQALSVCPECGAPRPCLPAKTTLLPTPLHGTVRGVAIAAAAVALGAAVLFGTNAADLRWRAVLRWNQQPYAPDRPLPLRALASDAVIVRFRDGCGLIVCAKPFAYVVRDLRALRQSGPPGVEWLGYRATLGYATAFWPGRDSPGCVEDAEVATGSFTFDTTTRRSAFVFTLPLGSRSVSLSTFGSLIPEYTDYTLPDRPRAAERVRDGAPADPAIAELRAKIPPIVLP